MKQKQALPSDDASGSVHLQKEDIPVSIAFKAITINQNNDMILEIGNFYIDKSEVACITDLDNYSYDFRIIINLTYI